MFTKRLFIAMSTATLLVSANVGAKNYHNNNKHHFTDYGRVVNSSPVYEYVRVNEPEERCWNETVIHRDRRDNHRRSSSGADALVGAVIGGVIGNQFGKGNGRKAATVAGTVIGASIATSAGNRHHKQRGGYDTHRSVERHCETVNRYTERRELSGYDVEYRYKGESFTTFMRHDPGKRIKLNVNIAVAE